MALTCCATSTEFQPRSRRTASSGSLSSKTEIEPVSLERPASRRWILLGAAAEQAGVPLVHYDRDYEHLARVSTLRQLWFVPDGSLA